MPVIRVMRQELVEQNLLYLLQDQEPNYLTDIYYWDTSEIPATICMLASIGTIIGKDPD